MSSSDLLNAPKEFLRLFKAGKEAAKQGSKQQAHALFRKAIEVDPYHEQIWLWLASVVETDEDRRVCFENVLELNPSNRLAKRQLLRMEDRALTETMSFAKPKKKQRSALVRWTLLIMSVLILVTVAVATFLILNPV